MSRMDLKAWLDILPLIYIKLQSSHVCSCIYAKYVWCCQNFLQGRGFSELSITIQDKEQFSSISCVQYNIIIWNIILRKNLNPLFVLFWRVSQWFRGILNANEGADLLTVPEVKNEFASDILQWETYSKKLVHC